MSEEKKLNSDELEFLKYYESTLNIMDSARRAGLDEVNIHRRLKSSSALGVAFKALVETIDKDPRFNKIGSISVLYKLEESIWEDKELEAKDKYKLMLDVRREINKMIEGNIAATKKVVTTREVKVTGVIDLTKPINEPKTIDVGYDDVHEQIEK